MAKKEPGTALVSMKDLEKQLAVRGQAQLEQEPLVGVPLIRTRGKKFSVDDNQLGQTLKCVVVGYSALNAYYDSDYDPDAAQPPACYAVGPIAQLAELKPAPNAPKPQHATCQGCPQNVFGSAERGKGKACRNMRRVAVIMPDEKKAEKTIAVLTLPPTAQRPFTQYVQQVARVLNRSLHGVVTEFKFDEDKDFPCPVPMLVGKIEDPQLLAAALAAGDRADKEILLQPISTDGYGKRPDKKAAKLAGKRKQKF